MAPHPHGNTEKKMAPDEKPTPDDPLEDFEGDIRFIAENTDLSPNQARELVRRHGRDRQKLLEAARTMKAES